MVTPAKGAIVASSFTPWPDTVSSMVGATFPFTTVTPTTEVAESPSPSFSRNSTSRPPRVAATAFVFS